MPDLNALSTIIKTLQSYNATLVAVSKTRSAEEIQEVINYGHAIFGENYVQELVTKQQLISEPVLWHFIGHLQSNKVKQIAPFVHLIHGVDSLKLAFEINKQALINKRVIPILLQVHIATEENKFGLSPDELFIVFDELHKNPLPGIVVQGLMGMSSLTDDKNIVRKEFQSLKKVFDSLKLSATSDFSILSMGMSSDYQIALDEGSTLVRIGSSIFGNRQ